jgi:hypothetical protein
MVYTPIRTVEYAGHKLTESVDLTRPLSTFINKTSFLVLEKNLTKYVIDLSNVILNEINLNFTNPISSALTSRLSDAFVIRYQRTDIPVLNEDGVYSKRLRVFNPISYKDYKTQFTSIDTPSDVDNVTRKGFLDDLVISSSANMTNQLVAVNGVFHRTTMFQNKRYVLDGFRTMRISDYKDVTVVDTSRIGGHSVIPLTTSNVSLTTYNGIATINSGVSLKNKTVFLVIDGYFYHMDTDVFYYAGESHLKVKVNKLPLLSQFRHNPRTLQITDRYGEGASQSSRKYIDTYAALFLNNRTVSTSTFTTRDFQYSRLTHYHSFLVVVNNSSLFSLSTVLLPTGTPQYYTDMSTKISSGMLSYGEGLSPSYVIQRDPYGRKNVLIQEQNYDVSYEKETVNPIFIPSLISEPEKGAQAFCRFVDYVSS